jgi:thiol:disulfide interchange protein DsbA
MAKKQSRFLKQQKVFLGVGAVVVIAVLGYFMTLVITEVPLGDFIEGEHYIALESPRRIRGDKIEVMEFFSYGCAACNRFDPMIEDWVKENAATVKFVRTPMPASESWRLLARHYFAMVKLGLEEQYHADFFSAIHDRKLLLTTPAQLITWAEDNQIEGYQEAFESDEVQRRVASGEEMSRRYQVVSVPTLMVHGKYIVKPTGSIGQERMLDVLDHLIDTKLVP